MFLFAPGIFWANFIILLLQMFGWLSNPFVTLLYMLEQTEILLFGGTARASDLRIIISFVVNATLIAIFTHTDIATDANLTIVYAIAAFLTSKNYMHTLGLKKPLKVNSDTNQKIYADIVFANLEPDRDIEDIKRKDSSQCPWDTIAMNVIGFFIVIVATIVMQVLFIEEDDRY